jgi:hypothetical protein
MEIPDYPGKVSNVKARLLLVVCSTTSLRPNTDADTKMQFFAFCLGR